MKEQKPMDGLASRRIALKVIRQVTEEGAYASLALDAALKNCGLSGADRRLVSRLVYDTLDHLIRIDWALAQVMAKPDTDIKLKNILRLGACQILLEDRIPDSAATNLCVQLCAELGMPGLKGVCNGILRNLIRRKNELLLPEAETDPVRNASIRYSVPVWLYLKLREDYGDEADRILSFRNLDDGWTLRPNLTRTDDAAFEQLLSKKVWKSERTDMPHAWKITGAMNIARDADYQAGNFSIQSVGSMIACLAVGVKRGQQILDCCAAPGGKTCYLAELMGGTGRVQAWDIHEHRVALIEAQAKRLGLENIRPMVRDAAKSREDLERSMDAVLLDAPCSGLGFMAQKPDLKLRVTEESVQELTALQEKLLDTVCTYVKPGGVLVYSTCSILKDENERQAARFLERHPEFEETALPDSIPERYRSSRERGLQLLEHRDGVEGFYLIRMRRKDD
ncbi:MAG: 16S rRNA (cytosine(967)-C(5))-methyltransferase RsmB [Clostridiales bacterium]|nr:16S rRNA (cytosine(967)-C(5))-methyltransferase RsmB [Clostridiales bacterium]